MNRYILFGITSLMAFSLTVSAQDEATGAAADAQTRTANKYPTRVVKGTVLDAATGNPLAGVLVSAAEIQGYSALTAKDGTYTLAVPTFTTALYITAPDHTPSRLGLMKDERQHDVEMYSVAFKAEYADETNVRGDYGATDFAYTDAINIKDEVQSQLGAYALTIGHNGTPGVGSTMFVQGLNSLNVNAQPLVVIDGVIIDQQYGRTLLHDGLYNDVLGNVNPADIESIQVMRNGTALYGAKGANGVLLIKTRRSKSMATRITASASLGVTLLPKFMEVMNADQYRGYASDLLGTTDTKIREFKFLNEDPEYYYYKQYHNETDWKKDLYREAFTQNYGINIEGGDNIASYNLSLGYTSAQSTLDYNDLSRLNIRFNTDINLTDNFAVRFDASFADQSRTVRDDGAPESFEEGTSTAPSFLAYVKSPFLSPYTYGRGVLSTSHYDILDEDYLDEALADVSNYNYKIANPMALNEYGDGDNKNHFETAMLNLAITPKYQFNKNLYVSEHFSYNLVNTNEKYYIPVNGVPDYYVNSVNAFRENETRSLYSKQESMTSDTRIDWNNRYGAHRVHLFGGARVNTENYTLNTQLGYNTGSDKTPFINKNLMNVTTAGTKDSWTHVSWYGQAEYDYMSRYYLQANLSLDGSSRFGSDATDGLKMFGAPWGLFWGVQGAWVVSNESWFARVKPINYLRLTAGYDVSGNDDIDYYAARSFFRASKYLNAISGLSFDGIGNTNIQWETTRRFNAGLEANLFNNRLNLSFNYFNSTTSDLLTNQSLNVLTGLKTNWANGGELKNQGYDAAFNLKVIALKDWQWQIGASVGHYENEITELPVVNKKKEILTDIYGATVLTKVGEAANVFYGYRTKGVFATTEQAEAAGLYLLDANGKTKHYFGAGDVIFVDQPGSTGEAGLIDESDRVVIGNPNPDFYGNIRTSLTWKRLTLDASFNYSVGNDVYNYMRSQLEGGHRFMNQSLAIVNRWQREGHETNIPRATFQDPMGNSRFSDRWIEDGSYLRLKALTLSYNIPMKSEYLQGVQVWVQGNNLWTATKYLGSDPEFSMTSAVLGQGIDLGHLPKSSSVVVGVKLNL